MLLLLLLLVVSVLGDAVGSSSGSITVLSCGPSVSILSGTTVTHIDSVSPPLPSGLAGSSFPALFLFLSPMPNHFQFN